MINTFRERTLAQSWTYMLSLVKRFILVSPSGTPMLFAISAASAPFELPLNMRISSGSKCLGSLIRLLLRGPTAIHCNNRAGHFRRGIRAQEHHQLRHVLG